ncbi:hypothetical protein GINT2_001661 [Glugoides intestinalis]
MHSSAVNPEYYNRKLRFKMANDYDQPIIHRKLGLSKPNEKRVYQRMLNVEFKRFLRFLNNYVCLSQNFCGESKDYKHYLTKLKSLNVLSQERFLTELSKQEFEDICLKIIEIYEKYFDIGYCHFYELGILQKNLSELYEKVSFKNKTEVSRIIDLTLWITDSIKRYKKHCI